MSLVVSHVLQVQLAVTVLRPLALGLLGVTVTLFLAKVALEGIHAAVDREPSVLWEAIPWMVKEAVQCVLQDCSLIVMVKVNARIAKRDTCVVEESRVRVLRGPLLLPRDLRLVLPRSLDIMSPPLVPTIRQYVSMENTHKREHQNALIVHQVIRSSLFY